MQNVRSEARNLDGQSFRETITKGMVGRKIQENIGVNLYSSQDKVDFGKMMAVKISYIYAYFLHYLILIRDMPEPGILPLEYQDRLDGDYAPDSPLSTSTKKRISSGLETRPSSSQAEELNIQVLNTGLVIVR
jgi:hypothetical protein